MRMLFPVSSPTSIGSCGRASGSTTGNDTSTRDTGSIRGTGGSRPGTRR